MLWLFLWILLIVWKVWVTGGGWFYRMALEEEIDMLKVQSSQDAATLHELKMALEQERDSKNYIAVACVRFIV